LKKSQTLHTSSFKEDKKQLILSKEKVHENGIKISPSILPTYSPDGSKSANKIKESNISFHS
jgi:hypothetical protein